jgi:hypothetical protein
MKNQISKLSTRLPLMVAFIVTGLVFAFNFASPIPRTYAAPVNPQQQMIFDQQICQPLATAHTLPFGGCADYVSQSDLDAAEKTICAKYASTNPEVQGGCYAYSGAQTNGECGDAQHGGPVKTAIDIGCEGKGNPRADITFAIIRIMSDGVGLVVIGSIIFGGIQYSASRGDPQSTAKATNRIRSSIFALLLYIFGYAILNYVIPGQFLK